METPQRFTIETLKAIRDAGHAATKKAGNFYEKSQAPQAASTATFFLESWDDEKFLFYDELLNRGFLTIKYEAPYHWAVRNRHYKVEYVEGDVYVTEIKE